MGNALSFQLSCPDGDSPSLIPPQHPPPGSIVETRPGLPTPPPSFSHLPPSSVPDVPYLSDGSDSSTSAGSSPESVSVEKFKADDWAQTLASTPLLDEPLRAAALRRPVGQSQRHDKRPRSLAAQANTRDRTLTVPAPPDHGFSPPPDTRRDPIMEVFLRMEASMGELRQENKELALRMEASMGELEQENRKLRKGMGGLEAEVAAQRKEFSDRLDRTLKQDQLGVLVTMGGGATSEGVQRLLGQYETTSRVSKYMVFKFSNLIMEAVRGETLKEPKKLMLALCARLAAASNMGYLSILLVNPDVIPDGSVQTALDHPLLQFLDDHLKVMLNFESEGWSNRSEEEHTQERMMWHETAIRLHTVAVKVINDNGGRLHLARANERWHRASGSVRHNVQHLGHIQRTQDYVVDVFEDLFSRTPDGLLDTVPASEIRDLVSLAAAEKSLQINQRPLFDV